MRLIGTNMTLQKLSVNLWAVMILAMLGPSAEFSFGQKLIQHTAEEPLAPVEAASTMRVPEGFRVTLFAGEPDVMQPIGFCIDDRARIWVAEAYNYPNHGTRPGDRIVILEDTDGDGRHDRRKVFYDGLNYVSGIEVGFGGVWVMSPPFMYFIADQDGDDIPDADPKVLLDGFGNTENAHNMANGFAWGPDGWLYATHGRTNWSMIGKPGEDESQRRRFDGGVWRYHPVRHVWEPFADGTTNPWGIDWNDVGDAFICNCVNPHLFQVIQGAHYEPWRGRKSSQYAYQRIDTIADHLHFVGLSNVRQGLGSGEEDSAGGGHAHCGTMIYLGDQFPSEYRNQLFTNNIHGRRINQDLLRRSGSGYVASHGRDLMRSQDPWYMGVTLAYGPGGEVYASDWSDTGECHSTRNTRRHTGRIYRISYLDQKIERPDVAKCGNLELVALQLHENDWWVRHARRLLHERAWQGQDMSDVHTALNQILDEQSRSEKRLRALWALQVTGGLSDARLETLLTDRDEFVRDWAVRLVAPDRQPTAAQQTRMLDLAKNGSSPRVRLSLASALQRLDGEPRWQLAKALASRSEDSEDPNLPLMIWYGIEPLIENDLPRFAELAGALSLSRVRQNMARRIASHADSDRGLNHLIQQISECEQETIQYDLINGILEGLEGRRNLSIPTSWSSAFATLRQSKDAQLRRQSIELAMHFQDEQAIRSLRQLCFDRDASMEDRRQAMVALFERDTAGFGSSLLELLDEEALRGEAMRGLARYDLEQAAEKIVSRYPDLASQDRQTALQTLASRRGSAGRLLDSIESGLIPAADLTAFTARQIEAFNDADLSQRLESLWGKVRDTPRDKARQIQTLQRALTPEVIAQADKVRGEQLFQKHCATCHKFFGQGGNVGPDITGAQRTNLTYMLENIIDPSASVAKEYRMQMIQTDEGRVLTGLVESESDEFITMINANERVSIPRSEISQRKQSELSVMPDGLLEALDERQIRDLFGYLQR